MKELFYYVRGWRGVHGESNGKQLHKPGSPIIAPIVTVCLMQDGRGAYARGVAICSLSETPCKIIGRDCARNYAMTAVLLRRSNDPVSRSRARKAIRSVMEEIAPFYASNGILYKSAYDITPTAFESKLIASVGLEQVEAYLDEDFGVLTIGVGMLKAMVARLPSVDRDNNSLVINCAGNPDAIDYFKHAFATYKAMNGRSDITCKGIDDKPEIAMGNMDASILGVPLPVYFTP